MQYIITSSELDYLCQQYYIPETCMRLILNHINKFEASTECSLMGEIEHCLENPHLILDITRHPSYAKTQTTDSSDQTTATK